MMRTAILKSVLASAAVLLVIAGLAVPGLAQEEGGDAQPSPPGGLLGSPFALMLIIILIFWVVVLLPQRKQQKRHQQRVSQLKSGDRVLTSGGIFGTVRRRNDDQNRITLEIAKNVQVEVAKSAISSIVDKEEAAGS